MSCKCLHASLLCHVHSNNCRERRYCTNWTVGANWLSVSFAKPSAYPTLEPLIAGRINVGVIRAHWPEILRVAASIRTGTVTASLIMRQLLRGELDAGRTGELLDEMRAAGCRHKESQVACAELV